jgi:hypothetical protein
MRVPLAFADDMARTGQHMQTDRVPKAHVRFEPKAPGWPPVIGTRTGPHFSVDAGPPKHDNRRGYRDRCKPL